MNKKNLNPARELEDKQDIHEEEKFRSLCLSIFSFTIALVLCLGIIAILTYTKGAMGLAIGTFLLMFVMGIMLFVLPKMNPKSKKTKNKNCYRSIQCRNSKYCIFCKNCVDCWFCQNCMDCYSCENCHNCVDCMNCINVHNGIGCNNLKLPLGQYDKYWMNNKEVTKKEFQKAMKDIRENKNE